MNGNINNSNGNKFTNPIDDVNYGLTMCAFRQALDEHSSSPRESYGMAIIENLVSHIIDVIFEPSNSKCAVEATRATKVMQIMMTLKTMMSWLAKKAKDELEADDYVYAISGALEGGFEIPGYNISVNPISTTSQNLKSDDHLKDFLNNIEKTNNKKSEQIPDQDDLSDERLVEFFEYIDGREYHLARAAIQFINDLANQKLDPKENKLTFSLDLIEGVVNYYINQLLVKDPSLNPPEEFSGNLLDGILTIKIMLENALTMAKQSLDAVSYNILIRDLLDTNIDIPNYIVSVQRAPDTDDVGSDCSGCDCCYDSASNEESESCDENPASGSEGPGCGGYSCESCWDEVCKYCHCGNDEHPSTNEPNADADTQKILSDKWDNVKSGSIDNDLPNVKVHVVEVAHGPKSVRENLLIRENEKLSKKIKKLKKKNKKLKKKLNDLYGK